MITFLFIQMVHGVEILWFVLVFPSGTVISMRLPDSASIFTAEDWAIIKALEQIKSLVASCLQALQYMKLGHSLIGMVIRKCVFFNFTNKDITFCWVPGHVGIRDNEKADSAAKSALDLPRVMVGVPNTDFKHHINQYILFTRQDDWNGAVNVYSGYFVLFLVCY